MNRKVTSRHVRLLTAFILIVGLGSSILTYLTAGDESQTVLAYDSSGGYIYQVKPEDSKIYMHDLELYGGKANVLMSDFTRWFTELWHGKSLAITIACITVLVAFGFFTVAGHFLPDQMPDRGSENNGIKAK